MRARIRRPIIEGMATFVVERYLPGTTPAEREDQVARVHAALDRLAERGVEHRVSLIVAADEMCMFLFDAEVEADVIVAHRHAGLAYDRVVAVDVVAVAAVAAHPP